MKSKFKFLILLTLTLVCGISAKAYDFESNGFYYDIKSLSDLTVSLTGYIDDTSDPNFTYDVVVPSKVEYAEKTFTVVQIADKAFAGRYLTSVTVPPCVTDIYINTSGSIESIIIEDGDTPISRLMLMGHGNVKNVYIGRNGEYEYSWFEACSYNPIESVIFGERVTRIGYESFNGCSELKNVTMPNVRVISQSAFRGCSSLKTIEGPNVESIGYGAFEYCTSLETFSFPNLKTIANGQTGSFGVFEDCTALKEVVLPQGLEYLGLGAFRDCTNLESVTLPASLIEIGDMRYSDSGVFEGCTKLMNIKTGAKTPLPILEDTFDPMTYIKATLHVPVGAKEAYQTADVWKNFFNIVEDSSINDDVVSVLLDTENMWDGTMYIQNPRQKYHIGDEITIVFEPESDEYKLSKVLVNDVNMISQVVDNTLTFILEGNTTVSAEFSWQEGSYDDHYLTIKQGEMGCVKMKVSEWDEYEFKIEAEENYRIHSVTYNGEDITEEVVSEDGILTLFDIDSDAVLNIAFESTPNTSMPSIDDSRVKVLGRDNSIKIIGYVDGESVALYNINGQLVQSLTLHGPETVIPVEENQVYIVRFKDKIVKLAI